MAGSGAAWRGKTLRPIVENRRSTLPLLQHTNTKTTNIPIDPQQSSSPKASLQRDYLYGITMDVSTRKQYLADDPPTVVPLYIKEHFEALNETEQKYAHYISRACFAGTRIVLRQVSPESESIYDFVIALHKSCGGEFLWKATWPVMTTAVTDSSIRRLLEAQDRSWPV